MPLSPEMQAAGKAAQDALVGILTDDKDMTAEALERIVQAGPAAVHGVLCGWANIVADAFVGGVAEGGEFSFIEVTNVETGQRVGLDDTGLPRAQRDAVRIVNLWVNKDQHTIAAMVKAYLSEPTPEPLCDLMIAVLGLAGGAAKHITEGRRRDREGS